MFKSTFYTLRTQHHNLLVASAAVVALLPFSGNASAINIQTLEALISAVCIGVWLLRGLVFHVFCFINQQKTLYLWALHTFTRLQHCYPTTRLSNIQQRFQTKFFLVIGNKQSGKSTLLQQFGAEENQSGFEYQQKGVMAHSVWKYKQHTLLETTCLMPNNDESHATQTQYWKNLLRLNQWHLNHQGFNAIMVVLSIPNIVNENKLHPTQSIDSLRSQVQNIGNQSPQTPLFLILTGLDQLPGFQTFFKNIDNEDSTRPLGFVVPQSLATAIDVQEELDNVTNDIEAFLVYQLEKVIHGEKNDVEKMHHFHEAFKALMPKIIQILYGIKTHLKNPVSGMFFTSRTEHHTQDNRNAMHPSALTNFYTQKRQSYFSKQILQTIDENTTWKASRQLQQCLLLLIGFLACHNSNISLNQQLVSPVKAQVNRLFNSQASTVQKAPPVLQQTTNSSSPKTVPEDKLWDQLKQAINGKITDCFSAKTVHCQAASLLATLKKSTSISNEMLTQITGITSEHNPSVQPIKITDSRHHDIEKLIKKLQPAHPIYQEKSLSMSMVNLVNPNFRKQPHIEQLRSIESTVLTVCQDLKAIEPLLSIEKQALENCQQRLTQLASDQALADIMQQYEQTVKTYHAEESPERFLKKIHYLRENTNLINDSMAAIVSESKQIQAYKKNISSEQWHAWTDVQNQINQFDAQQYKKTLETVFTLASNIMSNTNPDMMALQTLEKFIEQDTPWHVSWDQIDPISKDCITSFEKVLINQVGAFLDNTWEKSVWTPYQDRLQNNYPFNSKSTTYVDIETFSEFFSTTGIINHYINKHLLNLIDNSENSEPRWKSIHGQPLPFNHDIISFIMGTHVIQKMYFSSQSPTPWFEGMLHYRHASDTLKAIKVTQDGQSQTLSPTQKNPVHIKWPYANESFSVSIELSNGQSVVMQTEQGPWSMIQFLSKSTQQKGSGKKHILKLQQYQHQLELEFETASKISPLSADISRIFTVPKSITTKTPTP